MVTTTPNTRRLRQIEAELRAYLETGEPLPHGTSPAIAAKYGVNPNRVRQIATDLRRDLGLLQDDGDDWGATPAEIKERFNRVHEAKSLLHKHDLPPELTEDELTLILGDDEGGLSSYYRRERAMRAAARPDVRPVLLGLARALGQKEG